MQVTNLLKAVLLLLVLMTLAAHGCKKSEEASQTARIAKSNLPVVIVDTEHLQVKHADGSVPPFFDIPAGDGFILDASAYEFPIPADAKYTEPDTIEVIADNQGYSMPWKPGETIYTVSPQTLQPLPGAPVFTGLVAGTQVVIAIGHSEKSGADGGTVFKPLWGAMANVVRK
jgi:hypothetical protein